VKKNKKKLKINAMKHLQAGPASAVFVGISSQGPNRTVKLGTTRRLRVEHDV
jgi:hypothetical protein